MGFEETIRIVADCLSQIGSRIAEDAFDGIIVKRLEASNTLDSGRVSNQSHIAITGPQMDMFPYVRADGYFTDEHSEQDNDLKKYFVAQIPAYLHKENAEYLDPGCLFPDDEKKVYISVVRSRRRGSPDQIQMSMIHMDSQEYVAYRRTVHAGSYLVMMKRKGELRYDIYSVKPEDALPLGRINNVFAKLPSSTPIHLDELSGNGGEKMAEAGGTAPLRFRTPLTSSLPRNWIVFGAPGTGKSYRVESERKALLGEGNEEDYERVTFHPDYSYADFVGAYKPVPCVDDDGKDAITYEFVPGPFLRVYVSALRSGRAEDARPHLLIIEEINRADVAAVFGDTFQLLDRDSDGVSEYPIQASADIRRYLARELGGDAESYRKLRLPNNMFLWATMNSADQGVFPMDTAFRRRWDFTYIGIDDNDEGIRGKYVTVGSLNRQRVEWNALRKAINRFLAEEKVNEDKQLGPYFLSRDIVVPKDGGTEIDGEAFGRAFKDKVLMYLFEDAARQRRQKLFEGSARGRVRYSEICKAFDEQGIGIFPPLIQTEANATNLLIDGREPIGLADGRGQEP